MKFNQLSHLAALAGSRLATAQEAHGEGLVGTEMGPVAFMWPSDRPWSATADNTAPCGSTAGVSNRTNFPLCESSYEKCGSVISEHDLLTSHQPRAPLPSPSRTMPGTSPFLSRTTTVSIVPFTHSIHQSYTLIL